MNKLVIVYQLDRLSAMDTVLAFGRLCPKKKHNMLLAVLIYFRNYAKILPASFGKLFSLSLKLCYLDRSLT